MIDHMRILRVIAETVDPNAVIAGGYVRDRVLRREPKDIDVYVHVPCAEDKAHDIAQRLTDAFVAAGLTPKWHMTLDSSAASAESDFSLVLDSGIKFTLEEASVDVLFFNQPIDRLAMNVLNSFDVALCQAAILPNGAQFSTVAFERDVADRTVTMYADTQHARRVLDKFPDFTAVKRYGDDAAF